MGVEILGADIKQEQLKATDRDDAFLPEIESKIKSNSGQGPEEPTKLGLMDGLNGASEETKEAESNGETKEADLANANLPKDAVDEWPAPKQIHSFYFVRFRTYEDPQLKAKIEQADKEIQKKNQARFQITEALKAKRSARSNVISQLKPLTTEDKKYRMAMDEKRKEMEPLQAALGKLRSASSTAREKGMGLCSSEEELNELIQSLHYRIQHESNTLVEEKQLLKEIKQLEGTRDKVIASAAMKAKIQDSLGQKEAIQDQVKLIGVGLDGVRKEQQTVRMQIKQLEEELKVIDNEISSLQEELTAVTEKREKAYQTFTELRRGRDELNACFYQNRSLLNTAKELAAKKDIRALEKLSHNEVEKFMSQWSSSKIFRDDYERRILPSLDSRQLSRDARMRNPDEKPIISEALPAAKLEATPAKMIAKQAKEDVKTPLRHDTVSSHKVNDEELIIPIEVDRKGKTRSSEDIGNTHETEDPEKQSNKSVEIDAAKLKEMKREEEIAKARLAMERKKKLAEKAAAKAAARAQKEAEKKQKEKEKRAKKKTGVAEPVAASEQIETDTKVVETEEAEVKLDTTVPDKSKEQKEKVKYRNRGKAQDPLPKVILKRKKSRSYGSWAAVAAAILALLLVVGGYYYVRN